MAHAVLKIPPLRERKEDIKNFALFFINNLEIKYQHKIELSSDALTYLLNQPWLGNIRQLESYLGRFNC